MLDFINSQNTDILGVLREMDEKAKERKAMEDADKLQKAQRLAQVQEEERRRVDAAVAARSAGNENIENSVNHILKVLNSADPNTPGIGRLKELFQGNPRVNELASKSVEDIETEMRERVWGKPAKSKIGRFFQNLAVPIAAIGGAKTDFSEPALKRFKEIQEMARKENRDDYLAATGGVKALVDLLKVQNSATKNLSDVGNAQVQGAEKVLQNVDDANIKRDTLEERKNTNRAAQSFKELQERLRTSLGIQTDDTKRLLGRSPQAMAEWFANASPDKRRTMAIMLDAAQRGGPQPTQSTTTKFELGSDGNPKPISVSSNVRSPVPQKTVERISDRLLSNEPVQQPPAAASQPLPRVPQKASPVTAPTSPSVGLSRTDPMTGRAFSRYDKNEGQSKLTQAVNEISSRASSALENLETGYKAAGLLESNRAMSRLQGFWKLIRNNQNPTDVAQKLANLTQDLRSMPGQSGLALRTAAEDMANILSLTVQKYSGAAASDNERSFIASFLPSAEDFSSAENLHMVMSRFKLASEVAQRARALQIEDALPQLASSISSQLRNFSYSRGNSFKTNDVNRKAGGPEQKLPELSADEVLWNAISNSPNAKQIASQFGLSYSPREKKATEQFRDKLNNTKSDEAQEAIQRSLREYRRNRSQGKK